MTFKQFTDVLRSKYPEAKAYNHGVYGGTESTKRITVVFEKNGRAYHYSGSYLMVLNRLGFNVTTQADIANQKAYIERLKKQIEKNAFGLSHVFKQELEVAERRLEADLNSDYII